MAIGQDCAYNQPNTLAFDQTSKTTLCLRCNVNSLKSRCSDDCLSGSLAMRRSTEIGFIGIADGKSRATYSQVRDHSKHRLRRAIRRLERDSMLLHSNQPTSTSVERWRRQRANQLRTQKSPWWHPTPFRLPVSLPPYPFSFYPLSFLSPSRSGPSLHPRHCFTLQRIS